MRTFMGGILRPHYFIAFIIALAILTVASVTLADIISGNVSTNSSSHVTYTNLTLNTPSSVSSGDLLLANVVINGGSPANVTHPTGWTQSLRTDNDTNVSMISYYKIAGGSEPSSYTWTIDTATRAEGGITQYSGVDTSNPIDASAGNTGHGKVATTSSITTSAANEEVIALFGMDAGTSTDGYFSAPTGMTEKYDVTFPTVGPSTAADDVTQVSAGASGSNSSTISGNKNRNWVSQAIALNKQSTAPSVNGTITTQAVNGYQTSTSFSHTVNVGNNQTLIVAAGAEDGGEDTAATYDGIAMTAGTAHGLGSEAYYDYWYLINPPTGTHDVAITFPSSSARQYAAITLSNTDQATPFDADAHVGGFGVANPSASVTTTKANDLILYYLLHDISNFAFTPADSELWYLDNESFNNSASLGASHLEPTATTTSVGGTGAQGFCSGCHGPWDLIAIPVRPAN
jgi:hypothetical protein